MKKDLTELGSSIVSGIKNVVGSKTVDPKDRNYFKKKIIINEFIINLKKK